MSIEAFERWPLAGIRDVLNLDLTFRPLELMPLINLNYNFALTVIRIVEVLARQNFSDHISWAKFDSNPYDMMLDLLAYKRLDFATIVNLITAGPMDYGDVIYPKSDEYLCLDTGSHLPLSTITLWPYFSLERKVASAYPLRGMRFMDVTGFVSLDSLNSTLAAYEATKLGKRYFNLDKACLSLEKTWSKLHHDINLKVCTKSQVKLNYIRSLSFKSNPEQPISNSKPTRRKAIPKSVREDIWRRDCGDSMLGRCFCCGNELHHSVFEAGHIIAHADGGSDDVSNLVVICSLCNRSMERVNMREFMARYYGSRLDQIKWP